MLEILSDPAQTGLVAVCTPEEMPVAETIELADRVEEETTVAVVAVVVNRVCPSSSGGRKRRSSTQLRATGPSGELGRAGGRRCGPVLDGGPAWP